MLIDIDVHEEERKKIEKIFHRNGICPGGKVFAVIIDHDRKSRQYSIYKDKRQQVHKIGQVKS
jgi:hypothetical protein